MDFPRAHTYGPPRTDGYQNCSWCTPNLRVRVPGTDAGRTAHDDAHRLLGADSSPWSGVLPFDPPENWLGFGRKSFPHYWPQGILAHQNTRPRTWELHYCNPEGEDGKYLAMGGLCRDAPLDPGVGSTEWRLEHLRLECRQAIRYGHDGFNLNIMVMPPSDNAQAITNRLLCRAAAETDPRFRIKLMLDPGGSWKLLPKADIAKEIQYLRNTGGCYHIDGKLVISTFRAEGWPVADWTALIKAINALGIQTVFWPKFLNADAHLDAYKQVPGFMGSGDWGDRNVAANGLASRVARIDRVHAAGYLWDQPVSFGDQRPQHKIFDESQGFANLVRTATIGMSADQWEPVTWNDQTEGSAFHPSKYHGDAYLRVLAYYLTWWKTRTQPVIVRDAVALAHRRAPWAAKPLDARNTALMTLRPNSTPAENTTFAEVWLSRPGAVIVRSGASSRRWDNLPAGVHHLSVPQGLGDQSVSVEHTTQTLHLVSPHKVAAQVAVQDLQYVASYLAEAA